MTGESVVSARVSASSDSYQSVGFLPLERPQRLLRKRDSARGTSLQRQQEGWRLDTGRLSAVSTEALWMPAKVTEFLFLEASKQGAPLWTGSAATYPWQEEGPGTSGALPESKEDGADSGMEGRGMGMV